MFQRSIEQMFSESLVYSFADLNNMFLNLAIAVERKVGWDIETSSAHYFNNFTKKAFLVNVFKIIYIIYPQQSTLQHNLLHTTNQIVTKHFITCISFHCILDIQKKNKEIICALIKEKKIYCFTQQLSFKIYRRSHAAK